jgi:tetratricopeptide (TPR) repeat protein
VVAAEGVKILVARRRGNGTPGAARPRWPGPPLDGWNYRRLLLFSAIAVALPFATMALVNPSGLKPLILPFLFFRNVAFQQMIGEYRTVDLLVDWPFDLVAGALLLGVILRFRQVDLTDLLISVGFGILAYQAVRGILPFAATAAPLLGRTWGSVVEDLFERAARSGKKKGARPARANLAERILLILVLLVAVGLGARAVRGGPAPFGIGKDPKHYPERALDFLHSQDVRGPMFNTDLWASSLLWRFHGKRYPVFVDARLEAYPESFWPDVYYRVLQAAPGWREIFDRYGIQFAILRRAPGETDDRIGEALWGDDGWGLVYWDDRAMIYLRRETESLRNRRVLREWEFDSFDPRRPRAVRDLDGEALARAAQQLERLRGWNVDSFLLGWTLGAAWTRQGRGEDAVDLFAQVAEFREARNNAAFAASRAEAELVAGRRGRWEDQIRRAGGDPEDPDRLFEAAALLTRVGQRERAIAEYRAVLAHRPGDADAMNNLALLVARDDGGLAEALELADSALARSPRDPYFVATRGEILFRSGRREEALAEFRRALDLLPAGDAEARRDVMRWILRAE